MHKPQTIFLEALDPSMLPLLKKAYKARICLYRQLFRLIYRYQIKQTYIPQMDRNNKNTFKSLYQCITV